MDTKSKKFTTEKAWIATVIIICAIAFISMVSVVFSDEDMFIMPNKYTGKVTVTYNQVSGVKEKFIGKKRAFFIPANGLLRTQAKPKRWFPNECYYYQLENGSLSPLSVKQPMPHGYSFDDSLQVQEISFNSDTPKSFSFNVVNVK
jgi:hypothetical protein